MDTSAVVVIAATLAVATGLGSWFFRIVISPVFEATALSLLSPSAVANANRSRHSRIDLVSKRCNK
jgi:hypothetical protein